MNKKLILALAIAAMIIPMLVSLMLIRGDTKHGECKQTCKEEYPGYSIMTHKTGPYFIQDEEYSCYCRAYIHSKTDEKFYQVIKTSYIK